MTAKFQSKQSLSMNGRCRARNSLLARKCLPLPSESWLESKITPHFLRWRNFHTWLAKSGSNWNKKAKKVSWARWMKNNWQSNTDLNDSAKSWMFLLYRTGSKAVKTLLLSGKRTLSWKDMFRSSEISWRGTSKRLRRRRVSLSN